MISRILPKTMSPALTGGRSRGGPDFFSRRGSRFSGRSAGFARVGLDGGALAFALDRTTRGARAFGRTRSARLVALLAATAATALLLARRVRARGVARRLTFRIGAPSAGPSAASRLVVPFVAARVVPSGRLRRRARRRALERGRGRGRRGLAAACPLPGESPGVGESLGAGECASEAFGVGFWGGVSGVLMVKRRESLAQTVPVFPSTRGGALGTEGGHPAS